MQFAEAYDEAQKRKLLAEFAYFRAELTRGEESADHYRRGERLTQEAQRIMRESE